MNDLTREELLLIYGDVRYYHDMRDTPSADQDLRIEVLKKIREALAKEPVVRFLVNKDKNKTR